ncbi:response regulator transcription factor [Actimicrobium sp. CCI2.3]|uniref:response regulator transcription factor n=1 Tax=Actimicrobium sp. CCI2.3 TaxID=3048616 RepID=UPI002AB46F2A|nr:response regulator transcription factor [Actimicrobium sp. CCI2.3]MDY7576403.1 response regulator transcription factor [Actimicrobium sp. CCI2.3]MEB0024070.1 response regulator transcription factor [Actimicrobium sp. CCI2.3]
MNHLLLIDDDVELADLLRDHLTQDGFVVQVAHNGDDGIRLACSGQFQLAVLDVMMPHLGGLDVLRRLRQTSQLPVLMLTARGDDSDRILGLELGADDYVPKPCSPRELSARVRAILRRSQGPASAALPLVSGTLRLWSSQRRVEVGDQPLGLTSTEFSLLEVLLRHAGSTVSKDALSEQALGRPLARFDRNIDVHLSSMRQKLARAGSGVTIQTVFRQGYQLIRE